MKTVNKVLVMIASMIIGCLAVVGFATLGLAVIWAAFALIVAVSLVMAWKTRHLKPAVIHYPH